MPQIPPYYEPFIYGATGLVGLVSCFFGYRLFKGLIISVMALAGAAALAWLGFTYGDQPVLWSLGGLVLGAILGGILAISFYRLAVGTLAAFFVATTLLPWVQPYDIWIQWAAIGGACLVAALLATAITNLMIQLASAMLGAFLLVHSALYFATGRTIYRAAENGGDWTLFLEMDLLTAGVAIALGLVGFLLQRRSASPK